MMDDISRAATMEFRPKIGEIGFPPPSPSDPREKKPKADDPDYSQKLLAHGAFNFERDVHNEAKREAELEELYTRPYEDIAVEEFLEKLPSPQVEEILDGRLRGHCRVSALATGRDG
eukprot:s9590_g1.t1